MVTAPDKCYSTKSFHCHTFDNSTHLYNRDFSDLIRMEDWFVIYLLAQALFTENIS